MRISPWLTLRHANEALRNGRPEEAHRLLEPLLAEGHRRAIKFSREVVLAYVKAGEKAIRADDPETAWQRLLAAESLNTGEPRVTALRQSLTRLALAECRAAMEAGNPQHVVEAVTRLRGRNALHPDFDSLEYAAQDWVLAHEMADRGDFLLANTTAEKVRTRLGNVPATGLEKFLESSQQRHEVFRNSVASLTDAAEAKDWKLASEWAAKVIAVAPNHREARNVQMRAWQISSPPSSRGEGRVRGDFSSPPASGGEGRVREVQGTTGDWNPVIASTADGLDTDIPGANPPSPYPLPPQSRGERTPKRFLLWIDGVGGYLVCLAPRVTFGQATGEVPIDIPLLADVSRLHAEISRDGEGYVLESSRGMLVNGTAIAKTLLKPNDRVTLGSTCQFIFHQPVAISPTARLELVSGHRLQIAVDGVLLMAENLILGPAGQSHIAVPWLTESVVLYRSKDGLGVRIPGDFRVDAKAELNRATLPLPSVVTSELLQFAVEAVGARL